MIFYLKQNGWKEGPFSIDELKDKNVGPESFVMPQDGDEWKRAYLFPELEQLWNKTEVDPAKEETSPVPEVDVEPNKTETRAEAQQTSGRDEQSTEKLLTIKDTIKAIYKGMGKGARAALWVAVAALLLLVLNPGAARHKEAVAEQLKISANELLTEKTSGMKGDVLSQGLGMLVMSQVPAVIDFWVDKQLVYDNYGVCSFSSIYDAEGGEYHKLSFGVLGMVFTFDHDMVTKYVRKYLE